MALSPQAALLPAMSLLPLLLLLSSCWVPARAAPEQHPLLPAHHRALREGVPVRPSSGSCQGRRVYVQDLGSQFHKDMLYGQREGGVYGRGTGVNGGFGEEKRSGARARDPQAMLRGASAASEEHYHEQYHDEGEGDRTAERRTSSNSSSNSSNSSSSNSTVATVQERPGHWPQLARTWFDTWANAMDVVFHARMAHYPCTVTSPEEADLVYIAYYGSLDISRHLGKNSLQRSRLGRELAQQLSQQPRFQRHQGRDHFVVLGRPYWDFVSNLENPQEGWGTDLLNVPAMKEVKAVTVEGSVWSDRSLGAPYATVFHAPGKAEVATWRAFVEGHARPNLFAFGGAVRRGAKQASIQRAGALRERVFWQCSGSKRCQLLDCENPPRACEKDWRVFTELYLSSTFCIQPPGDSCTRRAVLDSMLAGCIPVVMERCTVEHQYQWLLGSAGNFSVFVEGESLKGPPDQAKGGDNQGGVARLPQGEVMLEQVLSAIPQEKVQSMQKLVLEFIPLITFGGSGSSNGTIVPPDYEDAFDYLVLHLATVVRDSLAKA